MRLSHPSPRHIPDLWGPCRGGGRSKEAYPREASWCFPHMHPANLP